MTISDRTAKVLVELVLGNSDSGTYRTGPDLIKLFRRFGFNDEYGPTFPSRGAYTRQKIEVMNEAKTLDRFLTTVFSPAEFVEKRERLESILGRLNRYLVFDGFQVKLEGRRSVVVAAEDDLQEEAKFDSELASDVPVGNDAASSKLNRPTSTEHLSTKRAFISHISEEAKIASVLKDALVRDFLGMVEVFVSSDTESIAAGEEWLKSVEKALSGATLVIVLCSPNSIFRPWINFEAGAAWMINKPLIPICHLGLAIDDLPMPLSLRQGLAMGDHNGLKRLYARVANAVGCKIPVRDFSRLAQELTSTVIDGVSLRVTQVC